MTNEIQVFENKSFGKVRTLFENGKFLFSANDVAKALGYSNVRDAISRHCKGVVKRYTPTNGGRQKINFITEGNVYRLIVHSKLPSAEKFEKWVFDEVLPSIRQNGGYIVNQENLSDEELMARALAVAHRIISNKDKQIEEMKPKAEFYDDVTGSDDTISIGSVAKVLNIPNLGRNKLFAFLREQKVLGRRNEPYQQYVDKGYFRQIETSYEVDGDVHINLKTVVFQSGLDFIRKLIAKNMQVI